MDCNKLFCDSKIYSESDWRKKMLNKKIELRNKGIIDFENNSEYKKLVQCKNNITRYLSENECKNTNNFRDNDLFSQFFRNQREDILRQQKEYDERKKREKEIKKREREIKKREKEIK